MTCDEVPTVQCQPGMRFGSPHVRGVSTAALADQVRAGSAVDEVAHMFSLSRADVLVACWFEATWGLTRYGPWVEWANAAYYSLQDGRWDVAEPPEVEPKVARR